MLTLEAKSRFTSDPRVLSIWMLSENKAHYWPTTSAPPKSACCDYVTALKLRGSQFKSPSLQYLQRSQYKAIEISACLLGRGNCSALTLSHGLSSANLKVLWDLPDRRMLLEGQTLITNSHSFTSQQLPARHLPVSQRTEGRKRYHKGHISRDRACQWQKKLEAKSCLMSSSQRSSPLCQEMLQLQTQTHTARQAANRAPLPVAAQETSELVQMAATHSPAPQLLTSPRAGLGSVPPALSLPSRTARIARDGHPARSHRQPASAWEPGARLPPQLLL